MKFWHLLFCCFIMSTASCQDSSIATSWNKLTSALINRTEVFENITKSVSKIIQVDTVISNEIKERKIAFKKLLHTQLMPDSNFIQQVIIENKKIQSSFSKVMVLMSSEPTLLSPKEFTDLQMQLMAIENRISFARKQYNTIVGTQNRKDLFYP